MKHKGITITNSLNRHLISGKALLLTKNKARSLSGLYLLPIVPGRTHQGAGWLSEFNGPLPPSGVHLGTDSALHFPRRGPFTEQVNSSVLLAA